MIFFQDALWAQKLEKVEKITDTETQEEEMEHEGEDWQPRRGGIETSRNNYGMLSTTFSHFPFFLYKYLGNRPLAVFFLY